MEKLPLEAQPRNAVVAISQHRQVDRGQVHADLVRAARLELHPQQRVLGQQLCRPRSASRRPAASRVSSDCRVGCVAVAADRRLDSPTARARTAAHEREVLALERPAPDEALQAAERLLAPRDDEQARRVAVEPVHDARALLRPARRAAAAQCSRERARACARLRDGRRRRPACRRRAGARPPRRCARPGRLGLVGRLGLGLQAARREPPPRPPGGGSSAAPSPSTSTAPPAMSRSAAAREPTSSCSDRIAVEPQARGRLRYVKRDQERNVEAPWRRRGLRSPASIVPSSNTTPTMMQTSAMLKAGHQRRSRKSVTWPSRTRSARFETLPPIKQAERDGQHRMARAAAREEHQHPHHGDGRDGDHGGRRVRKRGRTRSPSSGRGGSRTGRRSRSRRPARAGWRRCASSPGRRRPPRLPRGRATATARPPRRASARQRTPRPARRGGSRRRGASRGVASLSRAPPGCGTRCTGSRTGSPPAGRRRSACRRWCRSRTSRRRCRSRAASIAASTWFDASSSE